MLDHLRNPPDDAALRCEALIDRVSALPLGDNPHAFRVIMAECDVLEQAAAGPSAICNLRDARHWLKLAFSHELHAYPPADLRRHMLDALERYRRIA